MSNVKIIQPSIREKCEISTIKINCVAVACNVFFLIIRKLLSTTAETIVFLMTSELKLVAGKNTTKL